MAMAAVSPFLGFNQPQLVSLFFSGKYIFSNYECIYVLGFDYSGCSFCPSRYFICNLVFECILVLGHDNSVCSFHYRVVYLLQSLVLTYTKFWPFVILNRILFFGYCVACVSEITAIVKLCLF